MIYKYIINFFTIIIIFTLFSCQKVEILDDIVFDYDQLPKITISAESKYIKEIYQTQFMEPYIDHSLEIPPLQHFKNWISSNLEIIGSENYININIINASLTKLLVNNEDAKSYQEKKIFKYEIIFVVEYILYDDSKNILAKTLAESKNSVTSSKFVSLFESERIVDNLVLEGLKDFTKKSNELLKEHMFQFLI